MRTARISGSGEGKYTPQDHTLLMTTPKDNTLPHKQNDWQTGVKTLPCPKLRLRVVKKAPTFFNKKAVGLW